MTSSQLVHKSSSYAARDAGAQAASWQAQAMPSVLHPLAKLASLGLVVIALMLTAIGSAAAYDINAALRFSPTSDGAGSNYGGYDREFIRQWEANPPKGFPTVAKANIEATKQAIARYEKIVEWGGWPMLPPDEKLEVGTTGVPVRFLRARLIATGELQEQASNPNYFDYDLEKAVKRFQASNGLTPTGVVDKRTVAALNVPATARLKQLKVNLGRLRQFTRSLQSRHVVVNIPAAQIEAIENGEVVSRHAGVVGKTDRQTPITRSYITDMSFNPVWTLPPTVISEDLIPRGREMQSKGQDVLAKFGIDAYGGSGKKIDSSKIDWNKVRPGTYSYRQQPGKENPMGFLRINFNSADSVFMHDTPSERIFGRNFRSASSGCIRVHNIETFAAWLLKHNKGGTLENILALKENGKRRDVRLKKSVQLLMVYLTAWATSDGVVHFRRDLYQRDGVGAVAAAY